MLMFPFQPSLFYDYLRREIDVSPLRRLQKKKKGALPFLFFFFTSLAGQISPSLRIDQKKTKGEVFFLSSFARSLEEVKLNELHKGKDSVYIGG